MMLPNLRVTVTDVNDDVVTLTTEQDQKIHIPQHLMQGAQKGMEIFLSIDAKPLVSADQHAKDILNEIVKE